MKYVKVFGYDTKEQKPVEVKSVVASTKTLNKLVRELEENGIIISQTKTQSVPAFMDKTKVASICENIVNAFDGADKTQKDILYKYAFDTLKNACLIEREDGEKE